MASKENGTNLINVSDLWKHAKTGEIVRITHYQGKPHNIVQFIEIRTSEEVERKGYPSRKTLDAGQFQVLYRLHGRYNGSLIGELAKAAVPWATQTNPTPLAKIAEVAKVIRKEGKTIKNYRAGMLEKDAKKIKQSGENEPKREIEKPAKRSNRQNRK